MGGRGRSACYVRCSVVRVLLIAGMCGLALQTGSMAVAGDLPLSEYDVRFEPSEAPVCMEYDVGYRLCNIELRRVGKVVAKTTIGKWLHRITGERIPALFLDMRVDSPDTGKTGSRSRISIHDRIVAVLTLPDLQALVFAKYTDEFLRPIIHASETRGVSVYDTHSGRLEFERRDLRSGTVITNLVNPEALLELSRRIRPIMEFLVTQYNKPTPDANELEQGCIVANLEGKVVSLRLLTSRDRSPVCLSRQARTNSIDRLDSLNIRTMAAKGSTVKPRNFRAWSVTFNTLARILDDDALLASSRTAPVETVVPLVIDYDLAVGMVRVVMTSIHLGVAPGTPARNSLVAKGPEPVGQE